MRDKLIETLRQEATRRARDDREQCALASLKLGGRVTSMLTCNNEAGLTMGSDNTGVKVDGWAFVDVFREQV